MPEPSIGEAPDVAADTTRGSLPSPSSGVNIGMALIPGQLITGGLQTHSTLCPPRPSCHEGLTPVPTHGPASSSSSPASAAPSDTGHQILGGCVARSCPAMLTLLPLRLPLEFRRSAPVLYQNELSTRWAFVGGGICPSSGSAVASRSILQAANSSPSF